MLFRFLTVVALSLSAVRAEVAVGDEICVEGLVMDNFCIDRGAMLDPAGLDPFTDAEKHTVHCLADVQPCIDSNFVILNDKGDDGRYSVGYRLDADGTLAVVDASKPVGVCDNGCTGDLVAGLRVGIKGTVMENTEPYLVSAQTVEVSNELTNFCGTEEAATPPAEEAETPPATEEESSAFATLLRFIALLVAVGAIMI